EVTRAEVAHGEVADRLAGGHQRADLAGDAQDLRAAERVHHLRHARSAVLGGGDERAQVVCRAYGVGHSLPVSHIVVTTAAGRGPRAAARAPRDPRHARAASWTGA